MTSVEAFRSFCGRLGIEMTHEEAGTNYAACMTVTIAVLVGDMTLERAIDALQADVDQDFHPGLAKKFVPQFIAKLSENKVLRDEFLRTYTNMWEEDGPP